MSRLHVGILALALLAAGIGIAAYKSVTLGLPLTPEAGTFVWTVESRIVVAPQPDRPVRLEMPLPRDLPRFTWLGEDFVSRSFSVAVEPAGNHREAVWTARRVPGEEALYYRLQLVEERNDRGRLERAAPAFPAVPDYTEPRRSAVLGLLAEVRRESADVESFARLLVRRYADADTADDRVELLREVAGDTPIGHVRNLIDILAGARIPARPAWTLPLVAGLRDAALEPWLQVHDGERWLTLDPASGSVGLPANRLLWLAGERPQLQIEGGQIGRWTFSVGRSQQNVVKVARNRATETGSMLMSLGLFDLPVQTQNVYRLILVVPVGALLVAIMRNVIGVHTFGTFMPVLIALAFRETELLLGLVLFSTVVALALLVRFYLEKLRLLLVPRLAAVLTVVVLIMAALSVVSHDLGIDRALSVALFPMVILAMTVERMSLVWEESGAGDALRQGLGSLAVAALAYLVINREELQYLIFVFPELLLAVLGITLLMGRYTGYRLTELWRFRSVLLGRGEAP